MRRFSKKSVPLPSGKEIRLAVGVYIEHAYGGEAPPTVQRFIPPDGFFPAEWLMSEVAERDPPDAPLEGVRSFALRMGNSRRFRGLW